MSSSDDDGYIETNDQNKLLQIEDLSTFVTNYKV